MKASVICSAVLGGSLGFGLLQLTGQELPTLHILTFMTAQEAKESGVASLAPNQLKVLDTWFYKHTKLLISAARASPSYAAPKKRSIDEVCADGALLVLDDGSIWSIESIDQIDTNLWLSPSDVTVSRIESTSGDFKYLLTNTDEHEKAHAKYLGMKD